MSVAVSSELHVVLVKMLPCQKSTFFLNPFQFPAQHTSGCFYPQSTLQAFILSWAQIKQEVHWFFYKERTLVSPNIQKKQIPISQYFKLSLLTLCFQLRMQGIIGSTATNFFDFRRNTASSSLLALQMATEFCLQPQNSTILIKTENKMFHVEVYRV